MGIRWHVYVTEQVIKSVSQMNNLQSIICLTQSLANYILYLAVLVLHQKMFLFQWVTIIILFVIDKKYNWTYSATFLVIGS